MLKKIKNKSIILIKLLIYELNNNQISYVT